MRDGAVAGARVRLLLSIGAETAPAGSSKGSAPLTAHGWFNAMGAFSEKYMGAIDSIILIFDSRSKSKFPFALVNTIVPYEPTVVELPTS